MIRFLQKDNRVVKALFVVIIAAASVSMVVYLIPGLTGQGGCLRIHSPWFIRTGIAGIFPSGETISQERVSQQARQQLQQRNPQYAANPMIVNLFEQQVGQQLVQQQILLAEAPSWASRPQMTTWLSICAPGRRGRCCFPNGKFIGKDQYASLIATRFDMSVAEFEESVKHDIAIRRLESLITAGVTVSDKEARELYRKNSIKVKFDYAVISSG